MPFSVSVDNVIDLCKVMIKAGEAIRSGRKAAKAYRKLKEEIEDFREVVDDIKPLMDNPPSPAAQRLLDIIDEKILAYENALDKFLRKNRSPTSLIDRLRWSFGADKRAASLRGELAKYHRSLTTRLLRFYAQQQVDLAKQQANTWLQYHAATPVRDLHPHLQTITIVDPVGKEVSFPLLLCNTYALLMDVLPIYYKHNDSLPGRKFVLRGDFQFVDKVSRDIVEPSRWSAILSDGLVVEMSVVLRHRNIPKDRCLKCGQSSTVTSEKGWATCSNCSYHFRVTLEEQQVPESGQDKDVTSEVISSRYLPSSLSSTTPRGNGKGPDWLRFRLLTLISQILSFHELQKLYRPIFIPPAVDARLKEMHEVDVKIFFRLHPKLDQQDAVLDYLQKARWNSMAQIVGAALVEVPTLPAELLNQLSTPTDFSSAPTLQFEYWKSVEADQEAHINKFLMGRP